MAHYLIKNKEIEKHLQCQKKGNFKTFAMPSKNKEQGKMKKPEQELPPKPKQGSLGLGQVSLGKTIQYLMTENEDKLLKVVVTGERGERNC